MAEEFKLTKRPILEQVLNFLVQLDISRLTPVEIITSGMLQKQITDMGIKSKFQQEAEANRGRSGAADRA